MLFPLHALSPACQPATLTPPNRPTPERNPNDTRTQPRTIPAPIPGPSPADIATKPRQHRAPQQHPQNTTERPAAGPPIRNASPPKNSPTVPPSIAMPETDAPEQDACHDQISEEVGSEARRHRGGTETGEGAPGDLPGPAGGGAPGGPEAVQRCRRHSREEARRCTQRLLRCYSRRRGRHRRRRRCPRILAPRLHSGYVGGTVRS